VTADLIN